MSDLPSRRSLLALTASTTIGSLAGCLGTGDEEDGEDGEGEGEGETTDPQDPSVQFRDWLTDPDLIDTDRVGGTRFEYTEAGPEQPERVAEDLTRGRASVLALDSDDVDAYLIQLPATVLFGEFDVSAAETAIKATDEFQLTGEYGSYRTAGPRESDGSDGGLVGSQFAIGTDAILIGRDLELWIDTHDGEAERLFESYPVFEEIFERLPDRTNVSGTVGSPPTWEEELEIDAWGLSLPTLAPGEITQTWVYAFDDQPTAEQVQLVEQNLAGPLVESIDQTETDDRFVTITGTIEVPDTDG